MDQSTTTGPALGYFSQRQELPSVTPSWLQSEERLKREDETTTGDYVGSMIRQDGIVNGLIGSAVGQNMTPDPNYNPFEPAQWKDLTAGVWPEYHDEFARAHSPAHALYIKDRLLEKQKDLTRLGDLGVPGTIGRFALGAVMPENLIQMAVGNEAAPLLALSRMGRAARIAVGAASGSASNAAFEKVRQSVNFENDNTALLEASLIGAAMGGAFGAAGGHTEARVAETASTERTALNAVAKAEAGQHVTPEEHAAVQRASEAQDIVRQAEEGHISLEEANSKLHPEDKQWLDAQQQGWASVAEKHLDELFPNRVTERTRRAFQPVDPLLQLGHDPNVTTREMLLPDRNTPKLGYDPTVRDGNAPIQVTGAGQAVPGASTAADIEKAIREAAQKKFPKDPAKAESWAMEQRATSLGYTSEPAMKISEARAAKVEEAPKSPGETIAGDKPATPAEPAKAPAEAPAAAPKAPAAGDVADWAHARTGEVHTGLIEKVREDGFLHLRDENGKEHIVHQSRLQAGAEAPAGFGPDSIGAARVAGTTLGGGPDTKTTAFSKARLDIFAVLNRSKSDSVKSLAFKLVKDAIQTDSKEAQYMTASEWKSLVKRTVGGGFHMEVRQAALEAAQKMGVPMWKRGAFNHEFHSLVTRLTRGDVSVNTTHPDIAPMVQRASKAQREVYAKMLHEMKQAGVKGADQLQPNAMYVNRVWSHNGIREAIEKHGEHEVYKLLATAINVPGFIGDTAKAKRFLDAVRRLEFSKVLQNVHLYAEDMGTLRGELARAGLAPDDVDLVVDAMFHAKEAAGSDKGRAAPMKYRFDINENLASNTKAGVLRISDLFENDSRVLVDSYLNSMAGHVGLAKHGIYSEADFQALVREAQDEALTKNVNIDGDLRLLQDVYNSISGRPMSTQDFSNTARVASAMRGYSRALNLGQLGIAATFEMKQAIGLMGFRAFWEQMPTFRQMVTAMRNGRIPDSELARDLENIVGFGSEMSSSYARAHEIDEGFLGQMLTRAEAGANHASHAVDIMSGNASMTSITRQLGSMMATQRMSDFAHGLKELTPKLRERMVGWGVDQDQLDDLLRSLKDHTTTAGNGRVESIDYERWLQNEPGRYHQFQTVVSRMVRDAIQDHDLGETMPFMHTTLGKVFGELKTFFLVAHAKNMLKNLSYRDATALQVALIGFLGEAMAYATQTSMNYAHDPSKLAEKLSPSNIGWAAFGRSPVNGMVPFLAETGYGIATGGKQLFSPDMTTNTGNRTFVPPALMAVQRLYAAPSTAFGLLTHSDQVTRQEGLDLYKSVVPNMIGLRNLGNWLTESLPSREPMKP